MKTQIIFDYKNMRIRFNSGNMLIKAHDLNLFHHNKVNRYLQCANIVDGYSSFDYDSVTVSGSVYDVMKDIMVKECESCLIKK